MQTPGPARGPLELGTTGPDPSPSAPARRRRRFVRPLLALACAAATVLALVHLPFVRDRVRQFAVNQARERFDTVLTIGELDYNLLTLSVTVRDVRAAASRASDMPFFRAERVSVRLRPGSLAGHLAFESIDLVRPTLSFTRDADGRYRLPSTRPGVGSTPRLAIDRLSVTALDLQIDGAPPLTIEAREVSVALDPRDAHIQGRLQAVNGTRLRTPAGTVVDIGVDGTIGLAPDTVLVGPLTLTLPGSRVSVEGTLPFAPGPSRLELAYRGSVSLVDAARFWPAIAPARGQVSASGTLAGPLSDLVLTFDASGGTPSVRGIAVAAANVKGTVGQGAVSISAAAIDVAGGRVTGSAVLGLNAETASKASAQWRGVALDGLLGTLDAEIPLPLDSRLDGEAALDWDDRGLPSLHVTARADAHAIDAGPPARKPASFGRQSRRLPVEGQARLQVSGPHWILDVDHRVGNDTTVSGRLLGEVNGSRFGATTVRGTLSATLTAADLARAVALLPATPDSVRAGLERLHGSMSARFDLSGAISDPAVSTLVDGEALLVDGVGDGGVHASFQLDRRGASFDRLTATLAGTTLDATGIVPFDRRAVDLAFTASLPDVARWLDDVPAKWRPSGPLSARGRVFGALTAARVDGRVSSARLAWPFWSAGAIDADVHLAKGRVVFDARLPAVRGSVHAAAGLTSPFDFDIAARIEQGELSRLAEIAAGLGAPNTNLSGTTTLSAYVTGSGAGDASQVAVELRAEALAGTIDGRGVRLLEPARIIGSPQRVAIDRLRLQVGDTMLSASGTLSPGDGPLRIDADGDLHEWWPKASGRVHASLEASGSPRRPALAGQATIVAASVGMGDVAPLEGMTATATLANDTLDVTEAKASWSGSAITARGRMPLALLNPWLPGALARPSTGVPLRVHATVSSLTEKAFAAWLGKDRLEQVRGTLGAQLDLEAPSLQIGALTGTAIVTQSETTLASLTVTQPRPARIAIGGGRIQFEDAAWTVGSRTLRLGGGIDVRDERPKLDLALSGDVDLGIARAFIPVALSGIASLDVRVTGDTGHPSFAGGATLADVSLGMSKPRVALSGASGQLRLEKDRLVVTAKGSVNGGAAQLSGSLPLRLPAAGTKGAADEGLHARGTGLLLEYPEGLRTTVDADVTYRLDAQGGILAGTVNVEPGAYRRTAPPSFSETKKTEGVPAGPPSFFDATRLDVAVATRTPGLMDNSYARVEVEGSLRIGGTIGQPAVGGRLQARENGQVFLRGNVFKIERGSLEFNPDPGAAPSVSLLAATRRSGYDIRLRLDGRVDDLHVVLTSDPPLAQPDLMALITTGSTSNTMSPGTTGNGQDAVVASISSDILGVAGKAVGLDSVRVGELELDLMGDDVDPQTRLTIGKSIGSWLDLLLSQNLRESGFTWAVTVHPYGSVGVRFVSADSQTNSIQVAHEIIFGQPGGRPRAPTPAKIDQKRAHVSSVTLSGGGVPEREVLDATKVRAGDHFEFFEWQRDRERIEEFFHARGYLQAQVSATREATPADNAVALRYEVRRGPATRLRVTGFALPDPVVNGIKAAWSQSVDDRFLREDLQDRVRGAMIDAGHLWSDVAVEISAVADAPEKTIDVRITPGPHASSREIVFEGRRAFSEGELRDELAKTGAATKAWRDPATAATALQDFYRGRGFLVAKVSARPAVLQGDTARLTMTVEEGRRHLVSRIEIRGAAAGDTARVEKWLGSKVGQPFNQSESAPAAKRIQAGFAADGYRAARATVTGRVNGEVAPVDTKVARAGTADVIVTVDLQLGVRSVVGDVEVIGRGETREAIIRRAIDMPTGSAASPATADRAQRRLYETEAFRSVDIALQPMPEPAPTAQPSPSRVPDPGQPTKVVVTLEEAPLYRFRYGVQLTDDLTVATQTNDLRPGVSAELRRRNLFGTALNGGIGGRYEVGNWSARGALNIPTSVLWPALSSLYFKQSKTTEQGETGPVVSFESSLTYQERWRLGQKSELSYGYSFTREELGLDVVKQSQDGGNRVATHRGSLFGALAWDHRDSVFDATRGWFQSSSLEYGEPALGSDFSYLRYLFQQTYYKKVGWLVLAGGGRVGVLVHLTGDDVQTYSLRFRTGGDRTVRGYEEESLSAPGESGAMVGGRAMLVVNGELRFPVWKWLKAATFVDAGNAFVDPAHISFKDLEVGTGLGIRLDTPYALFRLDVGFPIPQRSGPTVSRWYFSIGQAF